MAPKPTFSLSGAAAADIRGFLATLSSLRDIVRRAKSSKPSVTPDVLIEGFASETGINPDLLQRAFHTLENIRLLEDDGFEPTKLVREIGTRLDSENADDWKQNESLIVDMLKEYDANHPIHISFKSQRLALLHENIYLDSEIISDARPVFGEDGKDILHLVVTHSLIVNYRQVSARNRIHFTLDARDVAELRKACDRALVKAQAMKASLGNDRFPVTVVNEDDQFV